MPVWSYVLWAPRMLESFASLWLTVMMNRYRGVARTSRIRDDLYLGAAPLKLEVFQPDMSPWKYNLSRGPLLIVDIGYQRLSLKLVVCFIAFCNDFWHMPDYRCRVRRDLASNANPFRHSY